MPLFIPEPHQVKSIRRLLDQPHCSLFSMPGSGKSATALSVIKIVNKPALIIAPLQPALISWPREIEKWLQFRHLDFAVAHGKYREKAFEHFITIMNPEGLGWLDDNKHLVRDKKVLFVDESHRFKRFTGKRTKYLRKLLVNFEHRHAMTGTPIPKSCLDWFSQQYLCDRGASFGTGITKFRKKYFYPSGYENRDWSPFEGTYEKMCEMAKDHSYIAENETIKMPGVHVIDVELFLPGKARKIYKEMERKLCSEKLDGVTADDETDKYGKLRQIAAGAVYEKVDKTKRVKNRKYQVVHRTKFDKAASIIDELGEPIVVLYHRTFEMLEIVKRLEGKRIGYINGQAKNTERIQAEKDWNDGKLDVLFMHPQSGAEGLNLQYGGHHMMWTTLPDSYMLYEQAGARMVRMDSEQSVVVYRLIMKNTVEKGLVVKRLAKRQENQKDLTEYLKSLQTTD